MTEKQPYYVGLDPKGNPTISKVTGYLSSSVQCDSITEAVDLFIIMNDTINGVERYAD